MLWKWKNDDVRRQAEEPDPEEMRRGQERAQALAKLDELSRLNQWFRQLFGQ